MSTIIVKARVCLHSEERIDNELLGVASEEVSDNEKYVSWRKICIPISMTTQLTQFSEELSLLHTHDGEILVREKFETLEPRWSKMMTEFEKENLITEQDFQEQLDKDLDEDEDE